MHTSIRTHLALVAIMLSTLLLIVGITAPVIKISGSLVKEGLAEVIASALEKKATPEERAKETPEDHAKAVKEFSGMIGGFLPDPASSVVYVQERDVVGSITDLYDNGAWFAATLILVFSVIVPFGKTGLLYACLLHVRGPRRAGCLAIINAIGKWSMADVFVVAIFIVYLAAKATTGDNQAIAFESTFGIGFYFFAAYCLMSLGSQRFITGLLAKADPILSVEARTVWITAFRVLLGFITAFTVQTCSADWPLLKTVLHESPAGPHGLTFGIFVLAPIVWKMSRSGLRVVVAVVGSHVTYALMVAWAMECYKSPYIAQGAVQGLVGAVLVFFVMTAILRFGWDKRVAAIGLGLSALSGYAVVGGITENFGSASSFAYYLGHLAWQLVVGISVAVTATAPRTAAVPYGSRDRSIFALACLFVVAGLGYLLVPEILPAVVRGLGITKSYDCDFVPAGASWHSPVATGTAGTRAIALDGGHLSFAAMGNDALETVSINPGWALDEDANYSISATTTWVKGDSREGYGLYWGKKDAANLDSFLVNADGSYRIASTVGGTTNGVWQNARSEFNAHSVNKLSMVSKGNILSFLINDVPVGTLPRNHHEGKEYGFAVTGSQTVLFEDLHSTGFAE